MHHLAIFASGTGSNARKIVEYFSGHPNIRVALIVSNRAKAGVLDMAAEYGVSSLVIDRPYFYESGEILQALDQHRVNFIVLAGFLWLVPRYLLQAYEGQIVNIHPALLPKYGGKGMYGQHVHRAVKAAGETESGMTIHYANEHYDEGGIIFQARCLIAPSDSAENIASKVLQLEHQHYAPTIERLMLNTTE